MVAKFELLWSSRIIFGKKNLYPSSVELIIYFWLRDKKVENSPEILNRESIQWFSYEDRNTFYHEIWHLHSQSNQRQGEDISLSRKLCAFYCNFSFFPGCINVHIIWLSSYSEYYDYILYTYIIDLVFRITSHFGWGRVHLIRLSHFWTPMRSIFCPFFESLWSFLSLLLGLFKGLSQPDNSPGSRKGVRGSKDFCELNDFVPYKSWYFNLPDEVH